MPDNETTARDENARNKREKVYTQRQTREERLNYAHFHRLSCAKWRRILLKGQCWESRVFGTANYTCEVRRGAYTHVSFCGVVNGGFDSQGKINSTGRGERQFSRVRRESLKRLITLFNFTDPPFRMKEHGLQRTNVYEISHRPVRLDFLPANSN